MSDFWPVITSSRGLCTGRCRGLPHDLSHHTQTHTHRHRYIAHTAHLSVGFCNVVIRRAFVEVHGYRILSGINLQRQHITAIETCVCVGVGVWIM